MEVKAKEKEEESKEDRGYEQYRIHLLSSVGHISCKFSLAKDPGSHS